MPDIRPAIETFLAAARQPVVMEPGEDPIVVGADNFVLTGSAARPCLECWDSSRNLTRRISAVRSARRGKLELATEQFGGRTGRLLLVDLSVPSNAAATLRSDRLKFRERFRMALSRQYPDWRIAELSTDPDLEHTLSPAYPRALLRKGKLAMAAIGASEDSDADGALSFGLIWLDYLRRREAKLSVGGLLVFVPMGTEVNLCHRVRHLNTQVVIFVHDQDGEEAVHPGDYGNFTTRVEPPSTMVRHDRPETPEAWLESEIRANLQAIDGTLMPDPVYRQAPHFAAANRGVMDLLAVDFEGRLAILEIKASEDLHLPLQALDYWTRVKWHLERGDFARAGYFPGMTVRPDSPRLLLVAPALQFHPTNESLIAHFSSDVWVERIGVGIEWRRELKVVLRQCR